METYKIATKKLFKATSNYQTKLLASTYTSICSNNKINNFDYNIQENKFEAKINNPYIKL